MGRSVIDYDKPTVLTELPLPKIPEGFVILQDTREQIPLFSEGRLAKNEAYIWKDKVPVVGATLRNGDYSVGGMKDEVGIELKRWSDFLSYVGKERQTKTIPKLERLSKMRYAALVVNEKYDDLWYPQMQGYGTKLTSSHIFGFMRSVRIRYGVDTYASESRELCQMWVLYSLIGMYNQILEERVNN